MRGAVRLAACRSGHRGWRHGGKVGVVGMGEEARSPLQRMQWDDPSLLSRYEARSSRVYKQGVGQGLASASIEKKEQEPNNSDEALVTWVSCTGANFKPAPLPLVSGGLWRTAEDDAGAGERERGKIKG